jgi:hypothetical protein
MEVLAVFNFFDKDVAPKEICRREIGLQPQDLRRLGLRVR